MVLLTFPTGFQMHSLFQCETLKNHWCPISTPKTSKDTSTISLMIFLWPNFHCETSTHTHTRWFSCLLEKNLPKCNPGTLTAGTQKWTFPEDDFPDANWEIFRLTVRYLSGVYHVGMLKVKPGSQGPVFIGKMVVPLGWRAPSCLIPPVGALQKKYTQ